MCLSQEWLVKCGKLFEAQHFPKDSGELVHIVSCYHQTTRYARPVLVAAAVGHAWVAHRAIKIVTQIIVFLANLKSARQ